VGGGNVGGWWLNEQSQEYVPMRVDGIGEMRCSRMQVSNRACKYSDSNWSLTSSLHHSAAYVKLDPLSPFLPRWAGQLPLLPQPSAGKRRGHSTRVHRPQPSVHPTIPPPHHCTSAARGPDLTYPCSRHSFARLRLVHAPEIGLCTCPSYPGVGCNP